MTLNSAIPVIRVFDASDRNFLCLGDGCIDGKLITVAHPASDLCVKASHLFDLRSLASAFVDAFVTTEAAGAA